MAEKKMTAAEKKAAAEAAEDAETDRKTTERRRLVAAGAVLAAVALFVGGYAVGNSSDNDSIAASDVVVDESEEDRPDRDEDRPSHDEDRPDRDDDRRGDRFPGPRSGLDFGFDFPDFFDLPDGFPRDFGFLDRFDFPSGQEGFGFGFECTADESGIGGFHCEFDLPEGFPDRFPFPEAPFFDDALPPDLPPNAGEAPAGPGFLGVGVTEGPDGVTVVEIFPGSAADDFGVALDDVILAVDGVGLDSVEELAAVISGSGAGTEVTITVIRNSQEENLAVMLGSPPS